ncbi:unnamed protein product [Mycena citricolor]|uniref:Uncharacterized protein n=1 Tax=Mycena citricolor TaxID=2018698 RepID=A0AAD2JYI4_9AGAR|nr:unnamed protein product [Mycena citricolor]
MQIPFIYSPIERPDDHALPPRPRIAPGPRRLRLDHRKRQPGVHLVRNTGMHRRLVQRGRRTRSHPALRHRQPRQPGMGLLDVHEAGCRPAADHCLRRQVPRRRRRRAQQRHEAADLDVRRGKHEPAVDLRQGLHDAVGRDEPVHRPDRREHDARHAAAALDVRYAEHEPEVDGAPGPAAGLERPLERYLLHRRRRALPGRRVGRRRCRGRDRRLPRSRLQVRAAERQHHLDRPVARLLRPHHDLREQVPRRLRGLDRRWHEAADLDLRTGQPEPALLEHRRPDPVEGHEPVHRPDRRKPRGAEPDPDVGLRHQREPQPGVVCRSSRRLIWTFTSRSFHRTSLYVVVLSSYDN